MQDDLGSAFKEFMEWKWQDALNIAAAGPLPWGTEKEKTSSGKGTTDKTSYANKGVFKGFGAVNVVGQQSPPQIALAIMGRLEWKEVSDSIPSRVRRGSRAPPVRQIARAGPGRKEESVRAEWVVPVLPEARNQAGVLRAGRLLKAKVHAVQMQWGAHSRRPQAAGGR
jgi:hypothetical protein